MLRGTLRDEPAGCLTMGSASGAPPSASPDPTGRAALPNVRGQIDATTQKINAVPALRNAPWLFLNPGARYIQSEGERPSLVFPPGTTYAAALTRLFTALAEDGQLPSDATLAPALPHGVALSNPADASRGVRLSLVAPWGYELANGNIRPPSSVIKGIDPVEGARQMRAAWAEGHALPSIAHVWVPDLPPCQVMTGDDPAQAPAPCMRGQGG